MNLAAFFEDRIANRRPPDFIVGTPNNPYLLRWYVIPRNPIFNIYLHRFLRSDDDRAHHDHPWLSLSRMLAGGAVEHTIARGGVHKRERIEVGRWRLRGPRFAHRIEIAPGASALTLFITGPKLRTWGFHCERGWVPWQDFTASDNPGAIGRGCGDEA